MKIIVPLPCTDFDPTEAAVPWSVLRKHGHEFIFATPNGLPAQADERMLTGSGLGLWKPLLMAKASAREAYSEMARSKEYLSPLRWTAISSDKFDALLLPGGHASGMKEYLESTLLQEVIREVFDRKPVAAICHGVVLVSRARQSSGKSVLFSKRTTCLLKAQELAAWAMTALWLGSYYRTYSVTVEEEVRSCLGSPDLFQSGPMPLLRDTPARVDRGFAVRDGHYLSARWPGDAHRFADELGKLLQTAGSISTTS